MAMPLRPPVDRDENNVRCPEKVRVPRLGGGPAVRSFEPSLPMSTNPLKTTFDVLASTGRSEADETLVAALDVASVEIRDLAASAVVRRASVRGLVEVLRRFDTLSDATRQSLSRPSDALSRAFRQSLKHGDERLVLNALVAAGFGGHVDQLPNVIPLLKSESQVVRLEAAETLRCLSDRLQDLLNRGGRLEKTDPGRIRDDALECLAACERFDLLREPERLVEPLLALGRPRHPAVVKVMRQSSPECRRFAADVLATSRHPGVIRLLLEFLGEPYPPRRVFEAVGTREDSEFIAALLRWMPATPTATQAANLRQIERVVWLDEPERIAELPEALQGLVPAFVLATGLPESTKMGLQEWLVRHASAEGRRGATQVFDRLDFDTTRRILLESLESDDEEVSAWATGQLRSRHVPGAFRLLVERLESPSEAVRNAARDELRGFTIEHLVAIHDRPSPALCRQAGQLIRKIDRECGAKLTAMIAGPVLRQRVAAARAAVRLGLSEEVRGGLLELLKDPDNVVRRLGVELLAEDRSDEVVRALREMTTDASPRVRSAAQRVLDEAEAVGTATSV